MSTPTLSDRPVVVITGASGGIGAALARHVAPTHALSLVARRHAELQAVGDELTAATGSPVLTITADVTSRGEVQRIVRETLAHFGRIDAWVNNVGQGITRMPSELTDDDIDDMMRINVKSALYGMQEVLPHFMTAGRGHVVNVSSMLGRAPFALQRSAYSAAKHFLNALTANFRTEVQSTHPDIHVSLISPGVVRTDFGLNARHGGVDSRALPESQSADDVAAVIAAVLHDRRPDVYTRTGSAARIASAYASIGVDP
ncbi:SDR family NAD(P)-dependent oxidoreductase [Gemmatimonas sp.]|uniref:SDR family NAD(P)-dependent oxidoreductase n=1 Tax=Gemmatimonas sp. TaxID=1962908 RepID=UPI00286E4008|nr:SDR family NAD(P)-dependent oxidoreductase [Gemmatimonas sp.]